ncbi:MAG: carboxypeptidase-like regulatory domain-containing protein [Bacteroidales bacterium]|jgi:hypothetical protein|nr:carboxypeptidase-like regulatory domain-containing protein [Bacteroidales bacterium]
MKFKPGLFVLLTVIFSLTVGLTFAQPGTTQEKFRTKTVRGTAYELLNHVSTLTGYLFVYDSKAVDNKKRGRIESGSYSIEEAVKFITQDDNLLIRKEGGYILIYKAAPVNSDKIKADEKYIRIEGRVTDRHNGEPVSFATVNPEGCSIGTITNQEGAFRLTLPDSLSERAIVFSSMGYEQRKISQKLLTESNVTIELMQSVIPLQEVIVRVVDPTTLLYQTLKNRNINYSPDPVNITAFYREGTEYKSSLILSEAVLKLFKAGLSPTFKADQVKLLKMRRQSNTAGKDTLIAKLRSTINAIHLLDIMMHYPDFLDRTGMKLYNYTHTEITEIDDRRVYVISFVQKEEILDALFQGELFIDAESQALVKAKFEVNPNHIRKFADNLIVKRSKTHDVIPVKASYEVSYKKFNGYYHISYVRGDLQFKVKKRGRMFTSPLHLWFEMANCKTDTQNVETFQSDERLSARDIFADLKYTYDPQFWEHFNIIMPEKKIEEIIGEYNFQ